MDMSDGARMRREESTGRAKSVNIRGRGARLEGDKVNVVTVQEDKKILKAIVRRDRKTTG